MPQDNSTKVEVESVKVPEVDELDDDEFESDGENADPNAFRIHEPLEPPEATLYTTQILHGALVEYPNGGLYECRY